MKYLVDRSGLILTIALISFPGSCPALTDVPPGALVWLQGYDLNPTSPPFRNEGTLKLECVDDALPIGLQVAGDGLHNAPGGLLLFSPGAGGSRTYRGLLLNEGRVAVNYGTVFAGPDTRVENRAEFLVSPFAVAHLLGPDATFVQAAGQLSCGYSFQVRDGLFDYQGGEIVGAPHLIRSTWRLGETVSAPVTAVMLGSGLGFEGTLRPGQELRLAGSSEFGPATLSWPAGSPLTGQMFLTSTNGEADATLILTNGMTLAPEGVLTIETAEGGMRRLVGDLQILGNLEIDGPLILSSLAGLTNTGRVILMDRGGLQLSGPYLQRGGTTEMLGGRLKPYSNVVLTGGTLLGHGTILGSVTNATLVQVTSAGLPLVTTGDWVQASAGTLDITCRAPANTVAAPAMEVQGTLKLGGKLRLRFPSASQVAPGAQFPLIASTDIQGYFHTVELPTLPSGQYWDLIYDGRLLSAMITTSLPPARLQLERAPDGAPRLRVFAAPASALNVEYSSDLKQWVSFTGRLQVGAGAVWISDLPSPPDGKPLFFRANTQP